MMRFVIFQSGCAMSCACAVCEVTIGIHGDRLSAAAGQDHATTHCNNAVRERPMDYPSRAIKAQSAGGCFFVNGSGKKGGVKKT